MNRVFRATGVVVVAAGLGVGLSGCAGGASADDLAASRTDVIETAQEVLPRVVSGMGLTVQEAYGRYEFGGDGIIDRRWYKVTVIATGSGLDAGDAEAALRDAGVTDVEENAIGGIYGVYGDLTVGLSNPSSRDLRLSVTTPALEVADGVPREQALESIDLG